MSGDGPLPIDGATPTIPAELEALDDRFDVRGDRRVERLWTGGRWLEGPVYLAAGRFLLFDDIPNDRMLRWDEPTGTVGVFRRPSRHANGNTVDGRGRLVTCEQGARRVTRTEPDGSVTVLADRFEGRRLNSPNDVVVHADGSVWFTDPPYGILGLYEGERADPELDGCHVFRVDPGSGRVTVVADDFERPNGLAFTLDGRRLLVTDSGRDHLRVLDVAGDRLEDRGEVLATCTAGTFDGVRLDARGRVWAAAGDGVHVLAPDGTLLGKLRLPETCANLAFGGPRRNRLFVTATTSLYSILLDVGGAAPPLEPA